MICFRRFALVGGTPTLLEKKVMASSVVRSRMSAMDFPARVYPRVEDL